MQANLQFSNAETQTNICQSCGASNTTNYKYCKQCGFELPKVVFRAPQVQVQSAPKQHSVGKVLMAIVGGILAFGITFFVAQQIYLKATSFDKELMQVAIVYNSSCPLMVDEETRLDNVVALPENIFQYNYTLVNMTKEEVKVDTLKKYLEPVIVNNVKTNPDLVIFREKKTTLNYYYKDKNGEFIHKISVTPDMYLE